MAAKHLSVRSLNTTRVLMTLVVIPLLLVLIGGGAIYLNLTNQTEKEAVTHSQNVAKVLTSQTDAFIRNRSHAVKLLASEKLLQLSIYEQSPQESKPIKELLQRYCTTLQASICYVMDREGLAIADNRPKETSLVGNNYAFRPYYQQAIQGNHSVHLALGVTTKKRGIYLSSPIYNGNHIIGVAIIKFLPDYIEEYFSGLSGQAALIDHNGIIFASNNPDWLYKSLFRLSPRQQAAVVESRQFGDNLPENLGFSPLGNGRVKLENDEEYVIESQQIGALPGWEITYVLKPEHIYSARQSNKHQAVIILICLLFLCTLLGVKQLYKKLILSLKMNTKYQAAVEESKDRLQRFEMVSSEAIFIHNANGMLDANKRAEKLLGYSHEKLLTLTPVDFFTPDSLELALSHVSSGSEEPYQANIITHNREVIPVVVTGKSVLWNGVKVRAASFRDIRKRIEVQKKLVASEDRFRQLSDLVGEGLLIHANGRIIDVNQSFCSIMGQIREDILSLPLDQLFNDALLNTLTKPADDTNHIIEVMLQRDDGDEFPAEVKTASMQFDDGLYTVLAIRDISSQKEQEEHILYQAQYDLLTHIPNRFLARDRAEQAIKNANKHNTKLVLMFIDLDGFKKVNDSLGHDVGDLLLQNAAKRFQSCLNESDTLARHGGDEFIILLEDIHSPSDAEIYIERILEQFSQPFAIANKELFVTTSIGLAVYPDDASDYQLLLRAADIGMYRAKKDGKNTFHYYTQEMNEIATRQLQLDNNLRSAMDNNEFSLVFQPLIQCNDKTQKIVGAEALLRWNSLDLGLVSPAEFIPLTEQTGMIVEIGRWVLNQACIQAKVWLDLGYDDFNISVNVSPRQFKGNNVVSDIQQALALSKLPAKHLSIEVTEGLLIQASPELNKTLHQISEMGVRICMDDFGTGYSSLNYLKTFPFDNLKIDRSFVNELPINQDSNILVSATIAMAHQLGLSVTAEGIETVEQATHLKDLHCDFLQGYLLGKPSSPEKFSLLLQKNQAISKERPSLTI